MNTVTHDLKTHSRGFYWAGLLLPRQTLHDAAQLYAFCRRMDDAVDERRAPEEVARALEDLAAGAGEMSALLERHGIPLYVMQAFLQGLLKDMAPVTHTDLSSVLRFGYEVAGTVGVMMSYILGRKDRATLFHAIDLGVAMQLVNIARDRAEDMLLGRDYIPPPYTQADLVRYAEQYFESGLYGVHKLPAVMRPAIMTAAYLYRGIGRKILANQTYAAQQRVILSGPHKAWLTLRAMAACLIPSRRVTHDASMHAAFKDMPCADTGA